MPRKHTKTFAKLSIYKMYYIKKCQTDFLGLHTMRRPLEARSYTKEFNRKPGRPSFWRKIKSFHFAISAKAIILVPRKHTKTFAKLSIYKMYHIKKSWTDLHGLHTIKRPLEARSYTKEFNRKPGRPSFWRKIKSFHFAISAKAIILVPRKHTKTFAKLSIYKMHYIKTKCQTDIHGLHTMRRPLEARSYTKEFNRKPGRPSFWRKIK